MFHSYSMLVYQSVRHSWFKQLDSQHPPPLTSQLSDQKTDVTKSSKRPRSIGTCRCRTAPVQVSARKNDHLKSSQSLPSLKLTVHTCEEAGAPEGNELVFQPNVNHPFSGALFSGKPNSLAMFGFFVKTLSPMDQASFDMFYGSSQFVFCHRSKYGKNQCRIPVLCFRFRVQRLEPIDARANFT